MTGGAREGTRGRTRGCIAAVAKAVGWSVVAAVLLVASAVAHLDTGIGRRVVCAFAEQQVSDLLRGELRLPHCAALRPTRIRVERTRLVDPDGREVARVGALEVRPDVGALLRGELRVAEVNVHEPAVSLAERDGELALLEAVALVDPPPQEDRDEEPTTVRIDRVRLTGGAVADLPDGLALQDIDVDLGVALDEGTTVDVRQLRARATQHGQPLARLVHTRGTIRVAEGERSRLELKAEAAGERVELTAQMRWGAGGPEHLEAHLRAVISPGLLRRLGQADAAAQLRSPVRVRLHVEGAPDDLTLDGTLATAGGDVQLGARYRTERIEAKVGVDELDLGAVLADAGGTAAGTLETTVTPVDAPPGARRVRLRGRGLRFAEWGVPFVGLTAVVADDHVRIEAVELPHLTKNEGRLEVAGRVGFDGAADVRLDARLVDLGSEPNVRRLAPGAGGNVRAEVHARMEPDGRLDVDGELDVRNVVLPGARVRRLSASGRIEGHMQRPRVDVSLRGGGIAGGGEVLEALELEVQGGPRDYRVRGNATLERGPRANVALRVRAGAARYALDGRVALAHVWSSPVTIGLRDIELRPDRGVSAGQVSVRGQGLALDARGHYAFAGPSDLSVELDALELEPLAALLGVDQELRGLFRAEARFRGTPQRPELEATVAGQRLYAAGIPVSDVHVQATWSSRERRTAARARADLGDLGRIRFEGQADLGASSDAAVALRTGTFDARLAVRKLALSASERLDAVPAMDGRIDMELAARGTLADPEVELELDAGDVTMDGSAALSGHLAAALRGSDASVELEVHDERALLLAGDATAHLDVAALARGQAEPLDVLDEPWSLALRTPARRLDELPAPARLEVPMTAQLDVRAAGGDGPMRADVDTELAWSGALPGVPSCNGAAEPGVSARIRLRDGTTEAQLRGRLDERELVVVRSSMATPLEQWIRTGMPPDPPPLAAEAEIAELSLERLPLVCEHASGVLSVRLAARDLLTATPRMRAKLRARDIRVGDEPPFRFFLDAEADDAKATARAAMHTEGRRVLRLDARAPLRMGEHGIPAGLGRGPIEGALELQAVPLTTLVGAVPLFADPGGALDGRVHASGTGIDDLKVAGHIELQDASLTVRDPFVRLEHVQGRVELDDQEARIRELTVRDRDGSLRLDGSVQLAQWAPAAIELQAQADSYPIRNEGVVFATVDGGVHIDGRLDATPRRLDIELRDLAVALPDKLGHSVQSLDDHAEVIYEDEPGFDRSLTVSEALAAGRSPDASEQDGAADATPLVIHVRSDSPFWVRRTEFALQLVLDVEVRSEGPKTVLQGALGVRRGFIDLMGKTFQFRRGSIDFGGALPVDPELDLEAVHDLPSGYSVSVHIGGHTSSPELSFSSTDPRAETETDVIALLMGVRGRESQAETDAQSQTRSMLAGVMAGLVGSLTRRELGQYVPILAVESRGTSDSTRLRAGFQVDSLIPKSWRNVVLGMYLEGSVGGADASTSSRARGGFLLELFHPHDLSTAATYEQPDNWSLELMWEP